MIPWCGAGRYSKLILYRPTMIDSGFAVSVKLLKSGFGFAPSGDSPGMGGGGAGYAAGG
jgi:hypothetical protein